MIAGLPGTGLGGIFYLMSTFLMPVRELGRLIRGKSSFRRWRLIMTQIGLSSGIMAGFWMTGWLLGMLIPVSHMNRNAHLSQFNGNILHVKPFVISMVVLCLFLITIEFLNLLAPKPVKIR